MTQDKQTNILLFIIAIALVAIALKSMVEPRSVVAQSHTEHSFLIEPGVQRLRSSDGSKSVAGRVVIDLQTGNAWGFPTLTGDPYPSDPTNVKPAVSHPFLLGRFALEDVDK